MFKKNILSKDTFILNYSTWSEDLRENLIFKVQTTILPAKSISNREYDFYHIHMKSLKDSSTNIYFSIIHIRVSWSSINCSA